MNTTDQETSTAQAATESGLSRLAGSSLFCDGIEAMRVRHGHRSELRHYYAPTPEGRALKVRHARMQPSEIRADVQKRMEARNFSSNKLTEQ